MQSIQSPLPLVLIEQAQNGPQKVVVSGQPYVIWKAGARFLATSAVCPHRGADLSQGQVCDQKIECPYHGWTINTEGEIWTPIENKIKGTQPVFNLTPRFGFLWLNGNEEYFQNLERHGGDFLGAELFHFKAPLHITVDTFSDGAHLPYVHSRNGPDRSQVSETQFEWKEDDTGITLIFDYSQRPRTMMSFLNLFLKTRWHVTARIEFKPIRVQYKIYWYREKTKTILNGINGNTFFFYPTEKEQTASPCLMFQKIPTWMKPLKWLLAIILRKLTIDLMKEDIAITEKILLYQKDFANRKLDRFDGPAVRVRQRLLETQPFGDF